ncbi:ribose transport system permease protein [Arthrobacter oryzae]|uniref:ABC transporter permease n=1 Tax=Arthrobacter oryzae TaxID=409290 RepID=UPI00278122E5|nr:ABC transporter permease [Arthrobacter oryzae]MDP9987438.1 ribose transport system permease protein [Arthrobacter oryzae]
MSTTSTRVNAAQDPLQKTTSRFSRDGLVHWAKEQYPLYILIVLLIVAGLSTDAFFTSRNLTNLILQVSVIGIVALAQFLIVLTGGIDISVGSVVGLAGVVCTLAFGGVSVPLAILVAIALGMLVGLLNGYFVAFRKLEPFIVTLGMLSLARGLVYALTEGVPVQPQAEDFRKIATTTVLGFPLIGLIWLALAFAVWFIARRTVFGRRVFALGSNPDAAFASGVPVKPTLLMVYVIAGAMVGFAGFLLASRVGVGTPTAGTLYELDSIAAVVIGGASLRGGKGRVLGVVFGTLIFGIITNLLVLLNVSTFLQDAFRGGLILLAVVMTTIHFKSRRKQTA